MKYLILPLITALLAVAGCAKQQPVIQNVSDAEHARIGIMTGSTAGPMAKERFPAATVQSFDDMLDAIAALKAGQVDVAMTAYPQALQVAKTNPDLAMIPERLDHEPTAAAIRKGNGGLLSQVNALVAKLTADGTLADMEKRWFKADLDPYVEADIAVPKSGVPLRVGVAATREPASFVDKNGRVTGFDGEMARRIAAYLNRPIEFTDMKFMALIPALQSGKIDIIVTGMSATDERRKAVDVSDQYFSNSLMLLARKAGQGTAAASGPAPLKTVADAEDKRVAVMTGSAQESYVTHHWSKAQVQTYSTSSDMILSVRTGKADVGLIDTDPLREVLLTAPELGILGEPVLPFGVGVGFSKASASLRQQFDSFLDQINADGTMADMKKRWIEQRVRVMPDLPPEPSGPPLVVGTSSDGMPFEGVVDNKLIGLDIEMLERFGRLVGRPVRFESMVFGGLVAAVASGKVDAISASIFITEERQKLIDFSKPYYQATSNAFALRTSLGESPSAKSATGSPGFWDRTVSSFRGNILTENRYLLLLDGLKTTVVISILATLFGTLLGAAVCLLRMSANRWVQAPARVYISILRGTPVLVLLMLIFYVVFASVAISPVFVAVVAFGMNFAAYVAEIFRTGIEGVDRGQTEAGIAMGFTRISTFMNVVLPQMVRRVLPIYKGEFISLVKMTSIVGYIAVQDLTKASDIIRSRTFDAFFPLVMVAVLYFIISFALLQFLEYLERATDPKARRRKAGVQS